MVLKYLKDNEANINNVLIITGDFNIRDSFWDSLFPNHLTYSDTLTDIADSLNLDISSTPQTQRYIYKRVMVCVQAVAIT